MHSKTVYATHIRKWLNYEWERLGRVNHPFDAKRLPLVSPKSRFCFICLFHNITTLSAGLSSFSHHLLSMSLLVPVPYQSNGFDCGVFVCRYAYNLYVMRHLRFSWDDYKEKSPFNTLITNGPAFQFGDSDITRIRGEMSTLIGKLSELYLPMLQKQEEAAKEAKCLFEKEQKMWMYLDQVKMEFANSPHIYKQYLDIMMTFKSQAIDRPEVIRQVTSLFQGNKQLVLGFYTLVCEGDKAAANEAKGLFDKEQKICSSPVDREHGRMGDKAEAGATGAKFVTFFPPTNVDKSPEYSDSSSADSEYLEPPPKKGKNHKKPPESLSIKTRHQTRKVRPPVDKAGAGAAGAKPGRVVGKLQLQSVPHQGILVATRCTKRSRVTIMGRKCALCASDLEQKDDEIIWIRVGKTDHPSYEMIRCRGNTCTIHPSDPVDMMWVKWQNTGTIEGVSRHQIVEDGLQPRQRKQPNFYSEMMCKDSDRT